LEHAPVEEEQRGESLVLGRGSHAFDGGEVGQERGHVIGAELARVPQVVMDQETSDPVQVGLFGAGAAVADAQLGAHTIELSGWLHDHSVPAMSPR
jgi:hypothetical protein